MNTYTHHSGLLRRAEGLVTPIRGMNLALAALEQFERMDQPCIEFVAYLSQLIDEARGKVLHTINGSSHTIVVTSKQVELWRGESHVVSYTLEDTLRANRIELLLERLGETTPYEGIELESFIIGLTEKATV
jgi:hypothetical protein